MSLFYPTVHKWVFAGCDNLVIRLVSPQTRLMNKNETSKFDSYQEEYFIPANKSINNSWVTRSIFNFFIIKIIFGLPVFFSNIVNNEKWTQRNLILKEKIKVLFTGNIQFVYSVSWSSNHVRQGIYVNSFKVNYSKSISKLERIRFYNRLEVEFEKYSNLVMKL